ncbi:PKD domain-containing protein [Tunicatimonas pelagia]|uniref:PKD domain-containing protein n=1 Tax=Tunicatimonas pelagia TaxID=931531 RepID=UPI0026666D73|nr:PKD domain-containing protein [Tunicatimonas pelagia]WKN44407.1 PKD domain-containing protein [Tunicatimonas pelagia]
MMNTLNRFSRLCYLVLLTLLIGVSACKTEDDPEPVGQPPVANAGSDLEAAVGSSVTLDGTGSSDPEGQTLTYAWSLTTRPDGSSASIGSATQATTTFTPDVAGTYVATLTVTDEDGNTDTDEATITAEEAVGEPPVVFIVNEDGQQISEDAENNTVTVGTSYALDGSNTIDPDTEADELTFTWEIAEAPDGSTTATINSTNENPDEASFVPDVIGEYTIRLTVEDPDGNSATAEVTIEADANPVLINSNITEDRTLTDVFSDPTLPDYRVTRSISTTAVLTVEPGVIVEFDENALLTVASGGGALVADGETDNKITFTTSNPDGGIRWGGIYFSSQDGRNILDNVAITFAGGTNMRDFADFVDVPANIGLGQGAKLAITNTEITNSGGYGMYIRFGELIGFSNNNVSNNTLSGVGLPINIAGTIDAATTFSGNTQGAIEIFGSTLSGDIALASLAGDAFYYVSGSITANADLTIDAGAELRMEEDVFFTITDDGSFSVNGTASDQVTMTAFDEDNPWGGIKMASTSSNNKIDYANIGYTGGTDIGEFSDFVDVPAAIGLYANGELQLTNTTIADGEGYGIYNRYGFLTTFENNTIVRNAEYGIGLEVERVSEIDVNTTFTDNTKGAVEIFGGTLNEGPGTWVALKDGAKYIVTGGITIRDQLTIEAGALFEFDNNIPFVVEQSGSLIAQGTSDTMIEFTSISPTVFKWRGILIDSSTGNNVLDFVKITYGGSSKYDFDGFVDALTNIGIGTNATVNITNSEISNSGNYGIYSDGTANANVEDAAAGNTFSDNPGGNVFN